MKYVPIILSLLLGVALRSSLNAQSTSAPDACAAVRESCVNTVAQLNTRLGGCLQELQTLKQQCS